MSASMVCPLSSPCTVRLQATCLWFDIGPRTNGIDELGRSNLPRESGRLLERRLFLFGALARPAGFLRGGDLRACFGGHTAALRTARALPCGLALSRRPAWSATRSGGTPPFAATRHRHWLAELRQ